MKVFIVVPAYNEEEYVTRVIQELRAVDSAWNIVVVDDASTDQTYKSARAAGVEVLRHAVNRGQGAALRTGTEWALLHGADIIIHFDADGQFEPRELPAFIEPLQNGVADVVLGSRFLYADGASAPESKKRRAFIPWTKRMVVLPFARFINTLITGIRLSDAHNGLRAFTRAAALQIRITQDRMAHNSNIISEIKKHHLRFKEMPITVYYHRYGQRSWEGFAILKDLLLGTLIK